MELNPLQNLYDDFVKIIDYVEIKYNNQAAKYETVELMKNAAKYISAVREEDDFFYYLEYPEWMLNLVGIHDVDLIKVYTIDRRSIPVEYQLSLLKLMRKNIISSYVEQNDYYRTLIGLPIMNDIDYLYVDNNIVTEYNINGSKPIHELSNIEISLLKNIGYIDNLKTLYPNKKYLNYLGADKVDLIEARTALNFAMLRFPSSIREEVATSFKYIYEQCREYFMTNLYIQKHTAIYSQYDGFMSLYVMVMTMQQVIMRSIKTVITREFFDERCIRMLFESYSVPYIENLDAETMKAIVHNLNILIQHKSTDKVFFNLMDIFGFERAKLYKYFIVKDQKFDEDGFPVIATKKEGNEFGEIEDKPDYDKMYDLYFQKVDIKETNYYLAMQKTANKVSYDSVVDSDPYWYKDDAEVIDELYNSEYNFRESKYIGVNITFRLSELIFNTVYLIRMLFDNKKSINNINVTFPKIVDVDIPLFDAIIFICAMICKKNRLKGEILSSPSKILYILGFNFESDFNLIRDFITENEYIDNEAAEYLKDMNVYTVESINNMYSNIRGLRDFISSKMSSTSNIYEYHAYEKLYKALYISKENNSIFNIDGDQTAVTYLDYLKFHNPYLYQVASSSDDDMLETYLNHAVSRVSIIIPKLDDLNYMIDSTGLRTRALMQLIDFFKSYTTDIINMNIIYIVDTKIDNMLKLIDHVHHIEKTIELDASQGLKLYDVINTIKLNIYKQDKLALYDKLSFISNLSLDNKFILKDKVLMNIKSLLIESINLYDSINIEKSIECASRILNFEDRISIISKLIEVNYISLHDSISIMSIANMMDKLYLYDKANISKIIAKCDSMILRDNLSMLSKLLLSDKLILHDNYRISGTAVITSNLNLHDAISSIITELKVDDGLVLHDMIKIIGRYYVNDNNLNLHDAIYTKSNEIVISNISMYDYITYTSRLSLSSGFGFRDSLRIVRD